jgi:hypothetical protein
MAHTQINLTIKKLRAEVLEFLLSVNKDNFGLKYDELVAIVVSYKGEIDKDIADKLLSEIYQTEDLDEYQKEVVMEICNRLIGYCSPTYDIDW